MPVIDKRDTLNKLILSELPFYNINFIQEFNFNNSITTNLPTIKDFDRYPSMHELGLFNLNTASDANTESSNLDHQILQTQYYSPHKFSNLKKHQTKYFTDTSFSLLHNNVRSLKRNLEDFQTHLLSQLDFNFSVMGITETKIRDNKISNFNPEVPGYNFEFVPTPLASGGVGMYIRNDLRYSVLEKCSNIAFQALWVEIQISNGKNIICGVLYRQHNSPESFQNYFEDTIHKFTASSSNKSIYIMGDFNIDLLKAQVCDFAQNFLFTLQSYALTPTIDKPTRIHNNSATLIDNILVNDIENSILSGNITSDISDHFSQFCIIQSNVETNKQRKEKMRDFSRFSETNFINDMALIDWNLLITNKGGNVDKLFNAFYDKVNKLVNKHAPVKPISKRMIKRSSKPWITKGIRRSIIIKNKLFYSGDKENYKIYRNKITKLTRISKKTYYHEYFNNNLKNMKKTWEGINNLINRKKKHKMITKLKCPNKNEFISNPKDIPDVLNKYFSTIGQKLASKLPNSHTHFSHYLKTKNYSSSFYFNPVTPVEVEFEIASLCVSKSVGLYSCPTRLLKCIKQQLSWPLAELMNSSILSGTFPSKLKHAKVVPIYKTNDETDPGNYRPISLLSNFNRIFEKLMCKRLQSFCDKYKILYEKQYGFRANHSTQHAVVDIVNNIHNNMDKGLFSCGVFIDLKKAFDTVDHSILLNKLEHYGIRGIINNWFQSYLTDRIQTVQIGQNISPKETIRFGVPQGSVLGPLLFLIYINDIHTSSKVLQFYLFADDTNLLYADKKLKNLEAVINQELLGVCKWLNANKLTINLNKTNYVIFRSNKKRVNYQPCIKLFDNRANKSIEIECKEFVKYLGLIIDKNLSWKHHIENIASKISKSIGIITRLRHFVPLSTLLNIYRSLIQPYLTYGIIVWGRASKTYLNKLLVLQKRVLRLMNFKGYKEHAIPLFTNLNVLPLNMIYYKSVCNLMYDVSNSSCPSTISDYFNRSRNIHTHKTRHCASNNFYIEYSRLNKLNASFARSGAKIWNNIPGNVRELGKKKFNKALQNSLLTILELEDDYVDVPVLVQLMAKQ